MIGSKRYYNIVQYTDRQWTISRRRIESVYIWERFISRQGWRVGGDTRTHQPGPCFLDPVARFWLVVGRRLDLGEASLEVHIFRIDELRSPEETSTEVHDREKGQGEVVGDEGVGGPRVLEEDAPTAELQRQLV